MWRNLREWWKQMRCSHPDRMAFVPERAGILLTKRGCTSQGPAGNSVVVTGCVRCGKMWTQLRKTESGKVDKNPLFGWANETVRDLKRAAEELRSTAREMSRTGEKA